MPRLKLDKEQLEEVVIEFLRNRKGNSFQFIYLTNFVAKHAAELDPSIPKTSEQTFSLELDRNDIGRVREIVWDQIMLRNLSVGSYDSDVWPYLSITEKGKQQFL